jgi:endonuclease G
MKWILRHTVFLLNLFILQASAQDSSHAQIDVFRDIESSKLKYIALLIDSVGLAAPVANEQVLKHAAFTVSYNPSHRLPNYVVHVIPKNILYGAQSRSNDFRPDPLLKKNSSDSLDYWNSGYDRGHMAASADFRWSRKALSESFYYSNIIPQNSSLNQGVWSKLETLVREWAIDNTELIVITGPVLNDSLPKIQQGSFKVSVPQYIYKIVLDYYPPQYKAIAFLYPNKSVPYELQKHIVSIDSIEKLTGIDFFPKLPDSVEDIVEAENNLADWDKNFEARETAEKFIPKNFGNGKINTTGAIKFIGKDACVCGRVVSTKYKENGSTNPTYINLDKKFPEQIFTLMIYGGDRKNFSYKPEEFLQGKMICIKGKISEYRGTPQIIAGKEKQVEVLKE